MRLSQGQLVAILIAVLIGIGVAVMPTKPKAEEAAAVSEVNSDASDKIKKAVDIITNGTGAPMEGIKLLKEVLEEDPNNEEALYYLGNFSIQSGQFDKAVLRFEALLQVNENHEEARYLLAHSQIMTGDTIGALKNYQIVLERAKNKELKELAEQEITNLKNI